MASSHVTISNQFCSKFGKYALPRRTSELKFIPSVTDKEFICLLGLEEVVQFRLEMMDKEKYGPRKHRVKQKRTPPPVSPQAPEEPFICAQCKTDVTCSWMRGKNMSVTCESCEASDRKTMISQLMRASVRSPLPEQKIKQLKLTKFFRVHPSCCIEVGGQNRGACLPVSRQLLYTEDRLSNSKNLQ